jgi:clan AA aspartic protease (TIGR02281 family)
MFVLDTRQKAAWALQLENQSCKPGDGRAQMWGTLTTEDVVPRRELNLWLIQQKLNWYGVFVAETVPAANQPIPRVPVVPPVSKASPSAPIQGIEVAMVRRGGTYAVPVSINGAITLDFVLDSGASDVSIPSDVFSTLIRAGTITKEDMLGNETYTLADGSRKKAATFNIRSLKVGATVIENVRASVADDAGPLLLGMSFLGRFPSWSVDNSRHVLVLK